MMGQSLEKIGIKWGLIVFALLSAYFGILQLLDFVHVVELRLFNGVILYFGIYKSIREFKTDNQDFSYFKGLGTGVITALVASTAFTLFGFGYLQLNPSFIDEIKTNEPLGFYMNQYGAVFQIFIEGVASGCVMSYANMQLLKTSRLSKK